VEMGEKICKVRAAPDRTPPSRPETSTVAEDANDTVRSGGRAALRSLEDLPNGRRKFVKLSEPAAPRPDRRDNRAASKCVARTARESRPSILRLAHGRIAVHQLTCSTGSATPRRVQSCGKAAACRG
jgi:hypothetical protein